MSNVRLISQGSTNDYEAFARFVKHDSTLVEANEPGTLAHECFADEVSGRVVFHELYENADAFVAHVENLMTNGRLDELLKVYEVERITILTRITDPRVEEIAQQFGAVQLHGVAGLIR